MTLWEVTLESPLSLSLLKILLNVRKLLQIYLQDGYSQEYSKDQNDM